MWDEVILVGVVTIVDITAARDHLRQVSIVVVCSTSVAGYGAEKKVAHETRHVIVGLECATVRWAGDDSDQRIRLVDR